MGFACSATDTTNGCGVTTHIRGRKDTHTKGFSLMDHMPHHLGENSKRTQHAPHQTTDLFGNKTAHPHSTLTMGKTRDNILAYHSLRRVPDDRATMNSKWHLQV